MSVIPCCCCCYFFTATVFLVCLHNNSTKFACNGILGSGNIRKHIKKKVLNKIKGWATVFYSTKHIYILMNICISYFVTVRVDHTIRNEIFFFFEFSFYCRVKSPFKKRVSIWSTKAILFERSEQFPEKWFSETIIVIIEKRNFDGINKWIESYIGRNYSVSQNVRFVIPYLNMMCMLYHAFQASAVSTANQTKRHVVKALP